MPTIIENAERDWRWQCVQWQTALITGSASEV